MGGMVKKMPILSSKPNLKNLSEKKKLKGFMWNIKIT